MGYEIFQNEVGSFRIKKENEEKALEAFLDSDLVNEYGKNHPDIYSVLSAMGWEPLFDDNEMSNLTFTGCRLGESEEFFKVLASFVEPGSFIEMRGEYGDLWRWVFDGKECHEIYPTIVWENDDSSANKLLDRLPPMPKTIEDYIELIMFGDKGKLNDRH